MHVLFVAHRRRGVEEIRKLCDEFAGFAPRTTTTTTGKWPVCALFSLSQHSLVGKAKVASNFLGILRWPEQFCLNFSNLAAFGS